MNLSRSFKIFQSFIISIHFLELKNKIQIIVINLINLIDRYQ